MKAKIWFCVVGAFVVVLGEKELRWELDPSPRFVAFPWWFRLAPPLAKRRHMEYIGMQGSGSP